MYGLNVVDVLFLVVMIILITYFVLKRRTISKISGGILVKGNYKNKLIIRILVIAVLILTILLVGYSSYKESKIKNFRSFIPAIYVVIFSIFSSSNNNYTIYENGIQMCFPAFFKWEDIKSYEWKNELLEFTTKKQCDAHDIKIKVEDIEKVQKILDMKEIS